MKSKLIKIALGILVISVLSALIPVRTEKLAVADYKFWDSGNLACPAVVMDNPARQVIRMNIFFQEKSQVIQEQVDACFPPDELVVKSYLL